MNLYIFEPINQAMVHKIVKQLIKYKDESVTVYIDSEGGEDNCDYAIYEALRLCGKKIITHAVNDVCSSAITVYLAGDLRYATNHSRFLIHEPYHENGDGAEKTTLRSYKNHVKDLENTTKGYFRLISERTELSISDIRSNCNKAPNGDWVFDTKNAMKLGLVHKIGFPIDEGGEEVEEES
jgi:ATP-dependent protease ClpP protease subunit